jgi:hypothetical protein
MDILFFSLALTAAAAWIVYNVRKRARERAALVHESVAIHGRITAKRVMRVKGRTRLMLLYEYSPNGQSCTGRCVVTREEFDAHAEGQMLALRYLPHRPSVSAPEFLLERVRRQRQKKL